MIKSAAVESAFARFAQALSDLETAKSRQAQVDCKMREANRYHGLCSTEFEDAERALLQAMKGDVPA